MPVLTIGFLALAACASPAPSADTVAARIADDSLGQLYREGVQFTEFLAKARSNAQLWKRNYETAQVPDALVSRVRAVGGSWRLLVVAVAGCSDSQNTLPYIARLAEVSGVELRIVDSDKGRRVMEAHRTPDGRAATPTVVLLNENDALAGCWIERPAALVKIVADLKAKDPKAEIFDTKMRWYDDDKGQETMREIVEIIEAARTSAQKCG